MIYYYYYYDDEIKLIHRYYRMRDTDKIIQIIIPFTAKGRGGDYLYFCFEVFYERNIAVT